MRLGLASLLVALSCFFCRPLAAVAVTSPTFENDGSTLTSHQALSPTSVPPLYGFASPSGPTESYLSSEQPPPLRSYLQPWDAKKDKESSDENDNVVEGSSISLVSPDFRKNLSVGDLVLPNAPMARKKELTVGYLTTVKGTVSERQGLQVSGAMTMALDEVRNKECVTATSI